MRYYRFSPQAAFLYAENRIKKAIERGNAKELSLTSVGLDELPQSIGNLKSLKSLWLGGNRLRELPDSMKELRQLRKLYLWGNELIRLPEWIGDLKDLRELHLGKNRLARLPNSIRELTSLRLLYLHDNEQLRLPPEILGAERRYERGQANPADLLDYYFRVRVGGRRPLNEAKLILLGRGEVGKTALVNRLVHNKFVSTSMTQGIGITHWPILTGKDEVRMHVWDFGGQEIQHATHQFFLTERSLYLLVLNGRAGGEDDDAEYWLKFIKTFGGSSPTIVVMNKIKVQPFKLNQTGLRQKYPFIRTFLETDCRPATSNGISGLKREIKTALRSMKHVRADFPVGWFEIKDRLAKMKKPFISFEEYRKICGELGENDPKAQERLAGFLDDLGIALNFREDQQLREETVLNPHWITEGVYKIITSELVADRQGELKLASLKTIFRGKKSYPTRMHGFLIELMRKFELCFPYQNDPKEHRYLVPELLGKEEPALRGFFSPVKCLNFRYDYRLMPEGLLPRFITRTHTMSKTTERWRTGVVLRWYGARGLVKADKQERQVIVRVFGEPGKRRRLLAVIRENFDQIHTEMKEFKPIEWVAVEGHPDEWIRHEELEKLERNNITEFPKTIGDDVLSVNVSQLLDKTDVEGARPKQMSRISDEPALRLFISYAHEDEKWRAKLAPNLGLLVREGLVKVWTDLEIIAGAKWDEEIKRKLEEADLYLFLMSVDLLNSDYVQDIELPIARRRHEENKARLIPVIIRKCSWTRYIGDIQGLPTSGRPVRQWRDTDDACFDVEEGLRKAIEETRQMLAR
jgi:internalin A